MEPVFCPYCGEQNLEELNPTEIMVDNDLWIIFHYECQSCGEVFDKIYLKGEEVMGGMEGEEGGYEEGGWN
ncbi:hypothetical protein FHQ18_11865 [Deferribacter autotrophicus]|uniref:Uncharacterized protein n=1 Tax=Deferribacter autotrophicus TaxID=500465 RepID=A0A5A8F5B6_9BACT|nr:hypothetical protein [Deferribacter autotrophicus]KAA0256819.1 hypothetical protein FHQ18_11865 [Deferribacter autotrophicus]